MNLRNSAPKIILVIAAHADDEALGCGGTIARHVIEGDIVHAVFLADGVSSRLGIESSELNERMAASEKARQILGITSNTYLGLPDNRLDSLALIEVIQQLEPIIKKLQPDIVYTHHHGDLNVDHRITHQAVLTVCRPMPGSCVQAIYAFEVMSSTEWATPAAEPFLPNHYVEISNFLNTKMEALRSYAKEMCATPHSRSMENLIHLASYRGNSVGVSAAEAFVTVRSVRKE